MTRVSHKNATVLFYGPSRETCLGLIIPGERIELEVSSLDIEFSANDVTYASLAGLKDAHGEFTGYYDKGEFHGAHPDGASGS
jgi:hypothetical protein